MSRPAPPSGPPVFALSDLHVDMADNMAWIQQLAGVDDPDAALIVAGDVSDSFAALEKALRCLRQKFAHVLFVPGNHELWVRRTRSIDSLTKFREVLRLCEALGVDTAPRRIGGTSGRPAVWIVPLFSWYVKPEEGAGSLYVPKAGEDPTLAMWRDNYCVVWPRFEQDTAAAYFASLNTERVARAYDAPVVSFSHFLPRTDLIFSTAAERARAPRLLGDPYPPFNFSRVAGDADIETQVRRLGSVAHVHGHQHRDRDRVIDGVRYVSSCLGYPAERGQRREAEVGPARVWPVTSSPADSLPR